MNNDKENFLENLRKNKIKKDIIDVIAGIDRKSYFDPVFQEKIYSMETIPIGLGQKSDDPLLLAKMIQILSPQKKWRLLEIGTGSGYSTSILASFVSEVVTVDCYEELAKGAKERIIEKGFKNVRFFVGDATEISDRLGEYDGIIIFAACIQSPFSVLNMLKKSGTAVFPMGPAHQQQITLFNNKVSSDDISKKYKFFDYCVVDSIKGKYGWKDQILGYIVDEANV